MMETWSDFGQSRSGSPNMSILGVKGKKNMGFRSRL